MAEIEIPQPDEVHEKAENPFTRTVALCVAVYAVGLAVASFGGHRAAKEMLMAKQSESNEWARYQAKSTREALYRNEIMKLEAEKEAAGGTLPAARQNLLARYATEAARMKEDEAEISAAAKHHQAEVALMQRKDPYFEFAEVVFQLSIVLASVAMLSGRRWAYYASVGLASAALLLAVNGFTLTATLPGVEARHAAAETHPPAAGH